MRDAKTNSANVTIYKNFKFRERAVLQWHMTLVNAFNHPNFSSVDPFVEDAGLASEGTGLGNPLLFSGSCPNCQGGDRSIRFGLKVIF